MKSEPRKLKPRISHYMVWMLLLLTCSLLQLTAVAQTAQSSNPVDTYIAKNPNSPLVKYYLFNPKNSETAHAIKSAAILDGPGKANYTPEDIARMEAQIAEVSKIAQEVDILAQKRGNYERAAMTIQAEHNAKKEVEKTQPSSTSGTPVISIPEGK